MSDPTFAAALDGAEPAPENFLGLALPYGPGNNVVLPYAVCRGAIFSSVEYVGRGARLRPAYVRPVLIASFGPVQVFQTAGEQLNQGAADVYAELVRLALERRYSPGERVEVQIQADAFLKSIGRDRGMNNRLWLAEEISRLKRASFRYEMPGLKAWETSFIYDFTEDRSFRDVKTSAAYTIELNPRMMRVYQQGWTFLKKQVRTQLQAKKDSLAKALYALYATHKAPRAMKASELKGLLGRDELRDPRGTVMRREQQNSKWLHDLRAALATLKEATGWRTCDLRDGVVHVVKGASAARSEDPYGDSDDI